MVVCPGIDELAAGAVADRVAETIAQPIQLGDIQLCVTASIGLAIAGPTCTADDLLRRADVALYRAKAEGRARVRRYTVEMGHAAARRFDVEAELRRAIPGGELRVVGQPIVSLDAGLPVTSVEALVRWEHPERGLLAPAAFLDIAEESGLIVPLGRFVMEQACRELMATTDLWRPDGSLPRLSINLSPRELREPGLVATIDRVLSETGFPPDRLLLEITEHSVIDAPDRVQQAVADLCGRGIGFALDDFGTGYSSMTYVRRFPVEVLKIDRSFVFGIGQSAEDETIVQTVAALGRSLGMAVVAEGVEHTAQADFLRRVGCDAAQGYAYGRPVPFADIAAHMAETALQQR